MGTVGDCLHWGLREGKKYLDPLLLLGNRGGRLRLVAEAQRRIVKREAEARAAAAPAARAGATTSVGRPGSHGFLHPVAGPVTSGFGMRLHPLLKIWKLHDGTDFGAACGTAIRAPYAGRGDPGLLQPRVRQSAVSQPRPRRRSTGRDGFQSRHALPGPARSAGQSGASDRSTSEGPVGRRAVTCT